jgi:hypothetical protein
MDAEEYVLRPHCRLFRVVPGVVRRAGSPAIHFAGWPEIRSDEGIDWSVLPADRLTGWLSPSPRQDDGYRPARWLSGLSFLICRDGDVTWPVSVTDRHL